jgi:hypothetical protein
MAPPDYREIQAVSVLLEARRRDGNYTGTIFRADEITLAH